MLNHVDILYVDDKLYELIDQFNERKIFILHYSTICIHFTMEMGEVVRYYLLPISITKK